MMNFSRHKRPQLRRKQRGFGVLSALLGLVVGGVIMAGTIAGVVKESQLQSGRMQGDLLSLIKEAGNTYTMEQYPALQNGLAVTKNGVTIPPGQILRPTVADLVAMGYLPAGTSGTAHLGGNYEIRLRREPVGCVAQACNIPGEVYIDQAVLTPAGELNGVVVGAIIGRLGGDVLVSMPAAPANLISPGGATIANPVGGNPPGVVAARVGFGSAGFGRFLVLNDPRDPNFQGNVTVAGTVTAKDVLGTNSVGAGAIGGCLRAALQSDGQVLAKSAGCIQTAWLDGTAGTVNAGDSTGQARAIMWGSGVIETRNAAGTSTVLVDGATGRIGTNGYAPSSLPPGWGGGVSAWDVAAQGSIGAWDGTRVRGQLDRNGDLANFDAAGNYMGGIQVSNGTGRATGQTLRPIASGQPGTGCGTNRSYGDVANSTQGGLVVCNGTIWLQATLSGGAEGSPCAVNGGLGVTSTGMSLVCSNGYFVSLTDRMGKWAMSASYYVANGSTISKPACGSGGTPKIYMIPHGIETTKLTVNHLMLDYGSYWVTSITNGDGTANQGNGIAQVGCFYS
jgi:hypothetical protein